MFRRCVRIPGQQKAENWKPGFNQRFPSVRPFSMKWLVVPGAIGMRSTRTSAGIMFERRLNL